MSDMDASPGVRAINRHNGELERVYWNGTGYDPRPVAGFWRKAFCFLVDVLIVIVLGGLIIQLLALPFSDISFDGNTDTNGSSGLFAIVIFVIVWIAYFSICYVKFGRTPGMMLGRLWVIDIESGKNLKTKSAIYRALVLAVVQPIGCITIIWAIMAATNDQRRGWHDFAGDSVVLAGRRPS